MALNLGEAWWVGVRITVVAKQMAAGVCGRDDITRRSLDPRTTVLLRNRCRRSLGEAYHPEHSIRVS